MAIAKEYQPEIAWRLLCSSRLLTKETYEAPAVYQIKRKAPIDRHDLGAGQVEIDCYFISFMGNPYTITEFDETTINLRDDFRVGVAPTANKVGIIYKSVGDGRSPFLAPVYFQFLHKTASENLKRIELSILWQYANLLNLRWNPKGILFSFEAGTLSHTGGVLNVNDWNAKTPEKRYVRDEQEIDETPTIKAFTVELDSFEIADPDAYYIYAQFPLDGSSTVSFRVSKEYWREKMFDGFLTVLCGVLNSEDDGRELSLIWGNKKTHPPVTIDPDSINVAEIGDDQVLKLTLPNPKKHGIIEGGLITWLYNLTYALNLTKYYIGDVLYICPATIFTLDAADETFPRIDVPTVTIAGTVEVIKGTPAENPLQPSIDVATQIELPFILLPANATEPTGITDELIYDENVEWTPSSVGVVVDFDNATSPFHGAKCASVGTIGNNDLIIFTASEALNVSDYESLSMFLKLKAVASTKNAVYIQFRLAGVAVTQELSITWAITDLTNWQSIAMRLSDFTFNSLTFDSLKIRWSRVQGTIEHAGFYLDYIKLQKGIIAPVFIDTVELTGDVTGKGKTGTPFETTLKNVITAGTFGGATKTLTITVDSKGRVTAVTENDIEGGVDGREVELNTSGGFVVWRYVGDVAWTNLFAIPSDGDDGVSAFIYIAYASAIDGTGFTLTDNPALAFSAVIATTAPLSPPVVGDFAGHWYQRKGADGTPGAVPLEITGLTLLTASWSFVSGLYEYDLANANITANHVVDVIPENADIAIVKTAELLPKNVSSAGSVKLYATNAPSGNIGVTIILTTATT